VVQSLAAGCHFFAEVRIANLKQCRKCKSSFFLTNDFLQEKLSNEKIQ
jgi:hypothetical protein